MLYPQTNTKRLALKLDGIWSFKKDAEDVGIVEKWARKIPEEALPMPVPAAFNEMTQDPQLRDYFGVVWYFRYFDATPVSGQQFIRFGAAVMHAQVFLNGEEVGSETLGKLPFEVGVTGKLKSSNNLLAVRIDTTLSWQTIPPGTVKKHEPTWSGEMVYGSDRPRPEYHFDFLNFGGLLRSVWLLSLPECHLQGIELNTLSEGDLPVGWKIKTKISVVTSSPIRYCLWDNQGNCVLELNHEKTDTHAELRPKTPKTWSPSNPYLYRLEVSIGDADTYSLWIGLRTVRVTADALLLNGKPTYLKGCGMHEDFHLVGQGHSDSRLVKDLTLLKRMGANSFRTSHYPYDESVYQLADQLGLLIIDETAAVGMNAWQSYPIFSGERCDSATLAHHKRIIERMVERDHFHPSVIMWSLANEVACYEPEADAYFKALFDSCRLVDPEGLPVTVVQSSAPPSYSANRSQSAQYCDIICWNRYYAWYENHGYIEDIEPQLRHEAEAWRASFPDKPLMLAEFGADAVAGMHSDPPVSFSEEYQVETIRRYCKTLDTLPYVIGEHVWNFADFVTKQGLTRIIGNRKGIHTRDRQPKMAAHYLKQRWSGKLIKVLFP